MASDRPRAGRGGAITVAVDDPRPSLSPEDRQLLERFTPYLQYDAQDGYRAVSAATMTDPPCNCLATKSGVAIAGKGAFSDLSLDVLAGYPDPFRFDEGDHLS